uniref:Ovule protein n=1 Tax=Brugia timori TaxID=42155 RepID=A0A0R3R699_9BILA
LIESMISKAYNYYRIYSFWIPHSYIFQQNAYNKTTKKSFSLNTSRESTDTRFLSLKKIMDISFLVFNSLHTYYTHLFQLLNFLFYYYFLTVITFVYQPIL